MAVRVWVVRRSGRATLVLRWLDPHTGRQREEATKTTNRREADRIAAVREVELERQADHSDPDWELVRTRFEREVLAFQRPKSLKSWKSAAKNVEAILAPERLSDLDTNAISRFASKLHARGLSLSSVACYLREIRRGLRWAAEVYPGYKVPVIRFPRVPKHDAMKGRPITGEEFERLLDKAAGICGEHAESWRFLLWGLWHSGLRLSEALDLWWDRPDKIHIWGIDQPRPMLRFLAESEKGRRDRLLPITPGFARLLWGVPENRRRGRVFRPTLKHGPTESMETVSQYITDIGKAAKVVVSHGEKKGKAVVKFASAQDLRRSFGFRLAPQIHPMQLKELMRHETLETTLRYYVGVDAIRTAKDVWAALDTGSCDQSYDKVKRTLKKGES